MNKKIFFMILSFAFFGCSKSNLPDFNKLDSLRLIAFQTATPEVNPGATVTLTPVVSDVNATGLSYSASSCIDPGVSFGADPTCAGNPTQVVIATNLALTLPGAAESWTGAANSFSVTVPIQPIIFANHNSVEQYNGVSYLIDYTLTNNSGQSVHSIKRIVVSDPTKVTKNQNPVVTNIFADGVAMTTLPLSTEVTLTTDLTMASAESYSAQNINGELVTANETLTTTWLITDGKTKYFRSTNSDSNKYTTADSAPTARSSYLIAVVRDGRGGLSFVKKKF
jgi:hypothetical protein